MSEHNTTNNAIVDDANGEPKTCTLIGGPFQSYLQLVLAMAALAALVVKRWKEYPMRPSTVWVYDVSKQVVGGLTMHAWNIFFAMIISDFSAPKDAPGNGQCPVYLVQLILDTAFGIVIMYSLLVAQEFIAKVYGFASLAVSGNYGNPPSFTWYKHQLAAYMVIVFVSKTSVSILVLALLSHVIPIGNALVTPFKGYPDMELVFVMILTPYFLNSVFFWVMDNLLMASSAKSGDDVLQTNRHMAIPTGMERDGWSLTNKFEVNDELSLRTTPPEPSWISSPEPPSEPGNGVPGKKRLPAWMELASRDV